MVNKLSGEVKSIVSSQLFSGSMIMLFGTNAVNFLAYIYHLFFGRILGPANYGELASIMSLIGLITSLISFFSSVIVRFTAIEGTEGRERLFWWIRGIIKKLAIATLIILFLISPFLTKMLSASLLTAIQIGPIMFFVFFVMVYNSFLQGLLKFKELIIVGSTSWLIRIVLGYALYRAGLSLPGVVLAILIASIVTSELGRRFIGFGFQKVKNVIYERKAEVVRYSFPVLAMTVATGSFVTLDVILARYFLSAYDSGLYAALATLGKIVVYASTPIGSVMFPLVSMEHAQGKKTTRLLYLAGLGTFLISLAIVAVYYFLPGLAVGTLYGASYLAITPYLARVGILNTIYAIDLLVVSYYLSRSEATPPYLASIAVISQVVGILLFHSSIPAIVNVSTFSAGLLLLILIVYSVAKREK